MNRETQKTLVFVAAAVLMTGAAFIIRPDRSARPEAFDDQGKKFFDDFDPAACTTLEVVDYDPTTAQVLPFKVTNKAGKWVIPSHYDYPADAKQRLIDTASGVIGLVKNSIRSDRVEDHEAFGVIDPLDTKATGLRGIGKHVTLRDSSDKILADFVIGKEVKDHPDQRYVRVPGQKRSYGVNVKVDLSPRFADWIETNLLKLTTTATRRIVIDHNGVDPNAGRLIPGEKITLERKDASSPWTFADELPPGKEPNTDTLAALNNALGDLKIAGIRPKPEGLTAELKEAPGEVKVKTRQDMMSLASKGFYLTRDGLKSNKGEVTVATDEGVVYTLRFGEVVFATGDELSAGTEPAKDKDPAKAAAKDPAKPREGTSEGRYLFATAGFDPAYLPPPKPPTDDERFPDDPFLETPGEPRVVAESAGAKARAETLKAERDRLVADGQKRAKELSDRFAAWYYVTPGDSYRTIVQDRANLVRDKGSKPPTPPGSGGRPGLPPGFPGLPNGLNLGPDGP